MDRPKEDRCKEDRNCKIKSISFASILLSIIISLIARSFFPYFNDPLGVPVLALCLILALFSTIIKRNLLSFYKPCVCVNFFRDAKHEKWHDMTRHANILSFAKDVLISAVWMYTMFIHTIIFSGKKSFLSEETRSNYSGEENPVQSPLDQFEIRNLLSLDAPILANLHLSLTNIRVYLTISAFIALMLNFLATNYNKVISNTWSISQESIYATLNSIVINQINAKKGQMYFPFIYVLFLFILVNNIIGMVPYSFASTSHFSLSFFISFTVVLGATILGFIKHGLRFFSLFVPGGCPLALLPLLVLIEFISYLARNVSLGLRLAANILSGHMLLNILSGFAYNIMTSAFLYFFIGLIPLAFIIAFSGLELGIAFIQAQVFVVLTSSYIKDALDLH